VDKLEAEIKQLIVEALELEDLTPDAIASDEPLFVDGLGLDSIDAMQLGVALRKRYDIKIDSVTENVRAHFATVRSLAQFVRSQQESRR
jgi:acyl carrier protein